MNARQEWRNAIRDSDSLGTAAKVVGLILDTYMDGSGAAWPARRTLAARCGISVRTVDRAVAALERDGFVAVKKFAGPKPNLYLAVDSDKRDTKRPGWRHLGPLMATNGTSDSDTRDTRTRSTEQVQEQGRSDTRTATTGPAYAKFETLPDIVEVDLEMLELAKGWLTKQ